MHSWHQLFFHAVDKVYEGTQKRTFLITLTLAALHIPFMVEIVALYYYEKSKSASHQAQATTDNDHDQLLSNTEQQE